ncbi:hypothetical protein [Baekduia sp.]|uniref:hypothetical protein n=1 Tax=Baekduia sp. TaxID=2600305 RepID=UPI002E0A2E62|nr:hypothetical protein [Baekduia sp.]
MLTVSRIVNAVRRLLVALAGVVAHPFGGSSTPVVRDDAHAPNRGRRGLVAAAVTIIVGLGLAASPALAASQVFLTGFGSSGSGAGQLSNPQDVAVDESTGDIYVADAGNFRIDKFSAIGNFILAFGRDVNQTTGGDICTAASGDICQAGTPGTGHGAFQAPTYVAVDNSGGASAGDVYVGDIGNDSTASADVNADIVSKFSPDGAHIAGSDIDGSASNIDNFGISSFGTTQVGIMGMTIDPDGNLWVYANGSLYEFTPTGQLVQHWHDLIGGSTLPRGIVADRSHVYVITGDHRLNRYTFNGLLEGLITRRPDGSLDSQRVALDPVTGELFVNRGGVQIEHYNASCSPNSDSNAASARAGCVASDIFGAGVLANAAGLALDGSTSTLYVADSAADQVKVFVPPSPTAPLVTAQWASDAGSTSATLKAAINPMQNDATCQFQYTDDATFQSQGYIGAATLLCDPADLGARFADQPAKVDLSGLAPGTIYHYRFLAHNVAGDDTGADRSFSTEISEIGLPDNRAYEQVSPADKDQGTIIDSQGAGGNQGYQAAADGNRMNFATKNALPGSASDGRLFDSARGSAAWLTTNQIPPQSQGNFFCIQRVGIYGASTDLTRSVLADGGGATVPCGKDDPELVPGEPEGVQNLFLRNNATGSYQLVSLNPVTGPPADAFFHAADPSFGHIVFGEAAQLTPDAPSGADNLYEWTAGSVKLLSVGPGGTPLPSGGSIEQSANSHHAVSDDGSTVFFQGGDGNLYARVSGTTTVQLDAAEGSGPGGGGIFLAGSADGSKVFFSDDASAGLTNDTQPGSGTNLYGYDLSTGDLTDLTPSADAGLLGLAGAGDSGVNVYFVATGDIASGATSGQPNLYSWHNGALAFIGTLSPDYPNTCVWQLAGCARLSADGSHLAFNSDQSLTGVDTGSKTEVYLYDQAAAKLVCASCPPTGTQVSAIAAIQFAPVHGLVSGVTSQPRNLSADGSRLFFTADGPLVARDTNGRQDVYEYSGGKPHLMSTGTATTGASFLDASASGDDVFFSTEQQLTTSDIDGARDIYDARVGGGFPDRPTTPCTGEGCKPPASRSPADQNPGSSSVSGPGNATPANPKPLAKLKVTRKSVSGSSITVTVRVPAKGVIAVSGPRIKPARKAAAKAGAYKVTAGLSAQGRRTLERKHVLRLKVRVSYAPPSGKASSTTVALTVKSGDHR